jgi:O-antigen/teichoic acid export membrane protein
MNLQTLAARNVGSSWLKLAIQLAVGFVLSPFILQKLGDTAFGIWVLIFSLTGYYGLFDFGIRASIGRYVARFVAMGDEEQLARFVNTSLAACSVLGLLVLLVSGIVLHYLGVLFKIPADFLGTARFLFLLISADVALGFPLSIFGCVLEGYQSFWSLNLTHICALLLRGILTFFVLSLGGGLASIALVSVGLNLLRHLACIYLVFWITPLRLGFQFLDRSLLGQLITYSSVYFTIFVAESLRFQSDAIVIGAFISSAAITYFAVAAKLVEYPASFVTSLAQIFTPMASQYDASGDREGLRRVFVAGNRACAFVIFPLCALLIILGKPIIEVWVGGKYLSSYAILLVLIVPKTLLMAQAGSTRILLGLGRQRMLALVTLLDGAGNLILSIVLLRYWGILGVALGTAIPLTCTSIFFLPRHLCRLLDVPLGRFLREAYLLPLGLSVPMAGALLLSRHWFHTSNYFGLVSQVALAAVVYGASWAGIALAKRPTGAQVRLRFAKVLQQAVAANNSIRQVELTGSPKCCRLFRARRE